MRRISCGSSSSEKRTEIKTTEIKKETVRDRQLKRERERLVRKTKHALAQWSKRPCKPKAQQTVIGLHQHPGQEGGAWIKHTRIRDTLLRGQPGEHEQSRNSTIQLYLCVRI